MTDPDTDNDTSLSSTTMDSPMGLLTLIATATGLRAVLWPSDDPARVPPGEVAKTTEATDHPVLVAAVDQLSEYFAGDRQSFDLLLDPIGTDFQQSAWMALRAIPYGTTVSYGEQAAAMGDKRKARAVGAANGRNPISIIVPCHRVVGSNGSLTGFAGGLESKQWLLDHESKTAQPSEIETVSTR
jgi:methylated-DNA-[protein]-cysteine S-methyltransferase